MIETNRFYINVVYTTSSVCHFKPEVDAEKWQKNKQFIKLKSKSIWTILRNMYFCKLLVLILSMSMAIVTNTIMIPIHS